MFVAEPLMLSVVAVKADELHVIWIECYLRVVHIILGQRDYMVADELCGIERHVLTASLALRPTLDNQLPP